LPASRRPDDAIAYEPRNVHTAGASRIFGDAPVLLRLLRQNPGGAVEVATAEYAPRGIVANAATLPPNQPARTASAPIIDRPGREVAGYVLCENSSRRHGRRVGSGADGSGRHVALKLLAAGREHAPETLERFVREGQLAAALSHPRSTFVYEAGAHEGQPYISMELMPAALCPTSSTRKGACRFPRRGPDLDVSTGWTQLTPPASSTAT